MPIFYHTYLYSASFLCDIALVLFSHFGALGNTIFFVCSAWFLLCSSQFKKRKWLFLLIEVWVISIIILGAAWILMEGNIAAKSIVRSFFSTLFGNNWYITCYLLFYPIHPLLNSLIKEQSKQSLFRISAVMFILYSVLNFLMGKLLFTLPLILWITIYFVMAYIQLFLVDFSNNLKKNVLLLLFGLIGFIGLAVITNYLGLRISAFQNMMLRWATNSNPFLMAISIAMFNIARNTRFRSATINYISSLSMPIYIIHENLILSTHVRPYMINYVYTTFGYEKILLWVLVIALAVLMFNMESSMIYDQTLRKLVRRISDSLYPIIRKVYLLVEKKALDFH